jgi:hypothetical protein
MNERIKQLAEQATTTIDIKCEGWIGRSYVRQEEFFDKEKFAELIVKECAGIFAQEGTGRYEVDGNWIAKTIKQHFGVEE